MTLQNRTTLAILFPALASIGLFGFFAFSQARTAILESAVVELQTVADVRTEYIERLVASYRSVAVNAATEASAVASAAGGLGPASPDLLSRSLEGSLARTEVVSAIHVIAKEGNFVASTEPEFVGRMSDELAARYRNDGYSFRPEAADALSGQDVVMLPVLPADGGAPLTVAMVPLFVDGEFVATVVVRFESGALARAVENTAFGRTGELLLAMRDEEGAARFLTPVNQRPDAAGKVLAQADQADVPMIVALEGREVVLTEGAVDYRGVPVVAVTRYLPDLDWGVVAKLDADEVVGAIRGVGVLHLGLGLTLAILAVIAGRVLGRKLTEAGVRLEQELASRSRAEARFRELVGTSPTAILALDQSGLIVVSNREAERLVGVDESALLGRAFGELMAEDSRVALEEEIDGASRGEEGTRRTSFDARLVHTDGHEVPVEVALTTLDDEGDTTVLVCVVDLTAREEARQTLMERADELARSNKDLDDFAHVASHDLKAPLRGISQLAMFIEEDAGDRLPEASRADLALLRGRVARLDRLLDGLLEYSRVGRIESKPVRVDARAVLRDVAELYVPAARFRLEVHADLPEVFAPPTAVEIVLRNLLMNAVKHHDQPYGVIRVRGHADAASTHIFVEDDGPGIPRTYAHKAFQLFQTLHPRDEVEGSGMGLALVRKAMTSCGGSIDLTDGTGRGACFHIRWPRAPRSVNSASSEAA